MRLNVWKVCQRECARDKSVEVANKEGIIFNLPLIKKPKGEEAGGRSSRGDISARLPVLWRSTRVGFYLHLKMDIQLETEHLFTMLIASKPVHTPIPFIYSLLYKPSPILILFMGSHHRICPQPLVLTM